MFIASVRLKKKVRALRGRAAPFRCRLVIMAKAPVAGAVKTRLAREVGHCDGDTLCAAVLRGADCAGRFRSSMGHLLVGYAGRRTREPALAARPRANAAGAGRSRPAHAAHHRPRPAGTGRHHRHGHSGHHGARTSRRPSAFSAAAPMCSALQPTAAIGWSAHGGGRAHRVGCSRGVRWSSEHALADTLANLDGRSVGFVATLSDVDDAAALARHGDFGRRVKATFAQEA